MQDYLKTIYRLRRSGTVTIRGLAVALQISSPSVTNMVKRLTEFGYLQHVRYGDVELTDAGERVARTVTRHHLLLEFYLVQALGYPLDVADRDAECLEHYVSEELEARISRVLGFSWPDDSGNPIALRDEMIP